MPDAAGWYRDPGDPGGWRYWDGTKWKEPAAPHGMHGVHGRSSLPTRITVGLGVLNVCSFMLLSFYLAPIGCCLGVIGLKRDRRAGAPLQPAIAAIALSLIGLAGAVFWFFNFQGFPDY